MAILDIPSIQEIKSRIVSDIESKTGQEIPPLPVTFIRILAGAIAPIAFLLYQSIVWVYKQNFPQLSDKATLSLLGEAIGIYLEPAKKSEITADVPGSGDYVLLGETFISSAQVIYQVTETTDIIGGVASDVPMKALTAGSIGNVVVGEELSLTKAVAGLDGVAIVTALTISGEDEEDTESYRSRVILRYRTKFFWGSPAGYYFAGIETPNFIWVGPYAHETSAGFVKIYGRVDISLGTDGIPTSGQLLELENYLRYDNGVGQEIRRPIGDNLEILPVFNKEFDITVFIENGNSALKADIEDALRVKMQSYEPYIIGVSLTRNDTLTNSDIVIEADSLALQQNAKVVSVIITNVETAFPESSYTFFGGEFGLIRDVTFQDVV